MKQGLAELRREAGLTQQALADAAGMNIRQIQKYEAGDYSVENMTVKNALAIAKALGCHISALL